MGLSAWRRSSPVGARQLRSYSLSWSSWSDSRPFFSCPLTYASARAPCPACGSSVLTDVLRQLALRCVCLGRGTWALGVNGWSELCWDICPWLRSSPPRWVAPRKGGAAVCVVESLAAFTMGKWRGVWPAWGAGIIVRRCTAPFEEPPRRRRRRPEPAASPLHLQVGELSSPASHCSRCSFAPTGKTKAVGTCPVLSCACQVRGTRERCLGVYHGCEVPGEPVLCSLLRMQPKPAASPGSDHPCVAALHGYSVTTNPKPRCRGRGV